MSVFPLLECGNTEAKNEGLQHLLLDLAYKFKYFLMGNEAARSQFVSVFLLAIADYFKGKLSICPEKYITGQNGHGPVDFALVSTKTSKVVRIVEVKAKDLR